MATDLNIPWKRYGLIAELAKKMESQQSQFGKTALQKMLFLLQEVYGVDCGYDFSLYTYGPFSSQIVQDLDFVETSKGVKVQNVAPMAGGYIISPGEETDRLRKKAENFLNKTNVQNAFSKLINQFGYYSARDLELISTIVYVARDLKNDEGDLAREKIVQRVKQLKPKFSEETIDSKIQKLLADDCIEVH